MTFLQLGNAAIAFDNVSKIAKNITSIKDLASLSNMGFTVGSDISMTTSATETDIMNITNKGSNIILLL